MVPQQVLLVPDFIVVHQLGWYNTFSALIVPWTAGVFGIFLLRQFFLTLPRDLYEAAMIDGCSRLGFLFKILVPLSIPPILTMSIFTFLTSWNSLIWPLIVTDKPDVYTIQVGLASFTGEAGTRWELLMAASTISILPLVILYFLAQRQFIEGIAQTGIKG
jgi:multiple sugar transport system permease protein